MLVIGCCQVQGINGRYGWAGCTSEKAEVGSRIKWRCLHVHMTQKGAEDCAFSAVQQARRDGKLKKLGLTG